VRLFLIEPDGAGGMTHYAYQMATALTREGVDVTLVTGRHYELDHLPHEFQVDPRMALWPAIGDTGPRGRRASSLGYRLFRRLRRIGRGVRYALAWHRLTKHLLRERPDIIQLSTIRFPFQRLFLNRLHRASIVLTQICHEFESRERSRVSRYLHRRLFGGMYHRFDRIYLHGQESREQFHRVFDVPRGRTAAIRHGNEALFLDLAEKTADVRAGFGVEPDTAIALFFGGLRPSKGIEDLIAAWAIASREVDGVLIVCGAAAGCDPARLRGLADDEGIAERTIIAPQYVPLGEVAAVFEMATVVVLPYRSVTGSGVLNLAFALGRPVIATSLGSLGEDVEHGETGLLVEAGDISAMARALVKILSDKTEAERMGLAARAAARDHDWQPIARNIAAEYRELVR
jgi:glycosyltransferase involved in cell wall biosynthesis